MVMHVTEKYTELWFKNTNVVNRRVACKQINHSW